MRSKISCIVLLACFVTGKLSAQTAKPDPFFVTDRVVEYDYSRKVFLNILPFDDPFTLKISKLPVNVSNLTIKFYEIRGNYNLFNRDQSTITEAEFIGLKKIKKYELNAWTRIPGNDSTFAYIPIPFSLKPNAKYVFSMEQKQRRELTAEEQANARDVIVNDAAIATFLNKMARSYTGTTKSLSRIAGEAASLNDMVKTALQTHDADLHYAPSAASNEALQGGLTEFIMSVKGYYRKLTEVEDSFSDTSTASKKAVTAVKKIVSESANWWDIANDTTQARRIRAALDAVDTTGLLNTQKAKIADAKEALADMAADLSAVINDLIDNAIIVNVYKSTGLGQSYLVNMVDQANFYIGLDVGYAYIGNFSSFAGYTGLNIYFRPVNKNIPLSRYKYWLDVITTRTSLLIGTTIQSIAKDNVRKGIIGNNGIIVGAGVRLNSWFRINGGALLYYRLDANPIMNKDRYSTKASPFISASIDIDVQQLIGGLGTSIFKTTSN